MSPAALVALLAIVVSLAALWPAVWRVLRTRDLTRFAPMSSTTTLAAFALWTTHGALVDSSALVATHTICLVASTLVVSARLLVTPSR